MANFMLCEYHLNKLFKKTKIIKSVDENLENSGPLYTASRGVKRFNSYHMTHQFNPRYVPKRKENTFMQKLVHNCSWQHYSQSPKE